MLAYLLVVAATVGVTPLASAQTPEPQPVDLYDSVFNDYDPGIDTCQVPVVESISVVLLEGGEVLVEVLFSSDHPQPQGNVTLSGVKLDKFTYMTNGIYHWTGDTEEGIATIRFVNPCDNSYIEHEFQLGCYQIMLGYPYEFWEDYRAWQDEINGPTLADFLNGLPYLTHAQIWSFFQATALNCAPISHNDYLGTIDSDNYDLGECVCDVITGSVVLTELAATIPSVVRNADGSVVRGNFYDDGGLSGGINRWFARHEINAGATKHAALRMRDLYGNNSFEGMTLQDTVNGGINSSKLVVTLQCLNGEGFAEECVCAKNMSVYYQYNARMEARAELRRASQERASGAYVSDVGYFAVGQPGNSAGDVIQNMSIQSLAAECERDLNAEFVNDFADFLTNLAGAAITFTDSTTLEIQDTAVIGETLGSLADLINGNAFVGTPCETRWLDNNLSGHLDTQLEPNTTLEFTVGSLHDLRVFGQRSYDSKAATSSGHALAVYVSSSEGTVPDWCCSEHVGVYSATSIHPLLSQSTYHDEVDAFLFGRNFAFPGLDALGDFGNRVSPNRSNPNCGNVPYLPLVLKPAKAQSYHLYNMLGQLLISLDASENLLEYLPDDGAYVLVAEDANGHVVSTHQTIIEGGRLLNPLPNEF